VLPPGFAVAGFGKGVRFTVWTLAVGLGEGATAAEQRRSNEVRAEGTASRCEHTW
jgi:hypothetical protein